MSSVLTSKRVNEIFNAACSNETKDVIICSGIMGDYALKKSVLEEHKNEIYDMLMELPTPFRKSDGGGYSFLCACNTKDGELWTGLHEVMERLFVLGIGIDKVKELLPRECWFALPGGMPYYMIIDEEDLLKINKLTI